MSPNCNDGKKRMIYLLIFGFCLCALSGFLIGIACVQLGVA